MATSQDIRSLIDKTPFVDTHEHLWEEGNRIRAVESPDGTRLAISDFAILFMHYADSDLIVSGMPPAHMEQLERTDLSPREKWDLVAPYYARIRHTGYGQCVRESVRRLYDVDDLAADTVDSVSEQLRDRTRPGYYRVVLRDFANIEYTQVDSLETPIFMETAQPDLLSQDLNTLALSSSLDVAGVCGALKREAGTLAEWHGIIDWCFDSYGPRAIATKNQSAYMRALDYDQVSAEDAAPLFARHVASPEGTGPSELKALQDHLFHYCLEKAGEYDLTVKLHTGYYAGHGGMPLHRVRRNAGDVCTLLQAHPNVRFDLFHIDYPYQSEMIALAKHYPNAWIDMCWAWIINPTACVRFVKEFLMAAPANKLFTFGGDMMPVELVPGHAALARQGLAQALSELVEEGWIAGGEIPELVERLMFRNAHECFDYERMIEAWK